MDLLIAFAVTFILLIFSVFNGIFPAYPLTAGLLLFFLAALYRGFGFINILKMAYFGGKKSFAVIKVLLLIGALIPIWMASGTVPAIVYFGMELIHPNLFILAAFLLSCVVSFLTGTSIGTSGVVGAALMVMAKSGNVNMTATAGAVIAGAYFGDRCSPVSSSAHFVAFLTGTNVYNNMKIMFRTGLIPLILSIGFYLTLSYLFPLHSSAGSISSLIRQEFDLNLVVMFPALIIVAFALIKVDVKISIIVSIAAALVISIHLQHHTFTECIKYMLLGFKMDAASPLADIIKGGGILSLLKMFLVVFITSAFAGIMDETRMLDTIERFTSKADSRYQVYRNVLATSLFGSAIGCSQTFAVMLTHMLNKKAYEKNNLDASAAAVDLENSAIMVSALIPWNVALLAPMTILGADASCLPYLLYIYLIPLWNLVYLRIKKSESLK